MRYIVKLKFKSPLHIGKGKPDYYAETNAVLHSDTLKSALFATAKLKDIGVSKDSFWDNFTVSSSMPFYDDVLFLPKPNIPAIKCRIWDEDSYKDCFDLKFTKKIKKIQFIQKEVFEQMNNGEMLDLEDYQFVGNLLWDKQTVIEIIKHSFNKNELEKFDVFNEDIQRQIIKEYLKKLTIFKKGIQERVKIYAIPEKEDDGYIFSRPYNLERLYFTENAGLYFFVESKDDIEEKLRLALDVLKDAGFGTDKNVGNGQFEYEVKKIEEFVKQPDEPKYKINLSLFLPDMEKNGDVNFIRYQLIERGGYIANQIDYEYQGIIRKSIHMFDVGSLFDGNMDDNGKCVDLKPENLPNTVVENKEKINNGAFPHPVWREGRAIFIPINFNAEIYEN